MAFLLELSGDAWEFGSYATFHLFLFAQLLAGISSLEFFASFFRSSSSDLSEAMALRFAMRSRMDFIFSSILFKKAVGPATLP